MYMLFSAVIVDYLFVCKCVVLTNVNVATRATKARVVIRRVEITAKYILFDSLRAWKMKITNNVNEVMTNFTSK